MSEFSMKLPDIGEGIAEAELVEWLVGIGDAVREDQVVAAVMTDKATVEIPSLKAGTVLALGTEVGSKIAIGSELIRLDVAGAPDDSSAAITRKGGDRVAASPEKPPAPAPLQSRQEHVTTLPSREEARHLKAIPTPSKNTRRVLASPSVRQRARELGIDLASVHGSGPAGRIRHEDLERGDQGPEMAPVDTVTEVKVVGLRRRIAENMAQSKRKIAHFSYVEEVDVTALEELREQLNARKTGNAERLTPLPFVMLAVAKALKDYPQLNALFDDEEGVVRRHSGIHIGVATQTAAGLMVPVVRHVERRTLFSCSAEVKRVSEAARAGTAHRDDLSGSTITVTSLGPLGGLVTTPVVNRPEVAIVGVNKIAVRPVWQNGGFLPRKMMNLSSSFDHRVVDGHEAASFIQCVRVLLEAPALLFVGVE